MAPEILRGQQYGKAIDVWSFGVVMYILLGGYPPFHDEDKVRLNRTICAGVFEFHAEYWGAVSEDAKDLIRGMLTVDPKKRLTIDQCLQHPWITKDPDTLTKHNLESSKLALRKYQALKKMKAGVKAVMAVNFMKKLGMASKQIKADNDAAVDSSAAADVDTATSAASAEDIVLDFGIRSEFDENA
jgi:serine/threonine protein kinase